MILTEFIENIGDRVINYSIGTYSFIKFLFKCIAYIFLPSTYTKATRDFLIEQIYLASIKHLFLFISFALFLGSILIVIAISFALNFNLVEQIGDLLVIFVINEFSPFFTSLFFIFAYSLSTEEKIQNIKKDKENLISEIYIPKLITGLIFVPLMALLFATIMIISGYIVSTFYLNIDLLTYKNLIISSIALENILILLFKGSVFGFISIFIPIYFADKKEKCIVNVTGLIIKILIIILSMIFLTELLSILIFY